jgi:DNA-binding NarL/FixJ family response regulator
VIQIEALGVEQSLMTDQNGNGRRRCLVIDDRPVVRLGVRHILDGHFEVDEADDGDDALQLLSDVGDFDVAVVDMRRAGDEETLSGTDAIRALLKAHPGLEIVALGERPERHVAAEAIRAGARAFVAKSSPPRRLSRAIEAALESETFIDPAASGEGDRKGSRAGLTKRQREILQLFADGQSTAQTAHRLGLSTETIRTHTKAILARLDARDRAHAVAIAMRTHLID